eukprot:scaffold295319_cov28-Tisochrysis_lutea.AAC.1
MYGIVQGPRGLGECLHPHVANVIFLEIKMFEIVQGPHGQRLGECHHPLVTDVVVSENEML